MSLKNNAWAFLWKKKMPLEQADSDKDWVLLKRNMDIAYTETHKNLNISLYGDDAEHIYLKPTWRDRLRDLRYRVHDAWLVLTGKADIS